MRNGRSALDPGLSIRGRMALSMLLAAALVAPVVLLAAFYIRSMNVAVNRIVNQDIEAMRLADRIAVAVVQARRDERGLVLSGDTSYLSSARTALERAATLSDSGTKVDATLGTRFTRVAGLAGAYRVLLDSLARMPSALQRRVVLPSPEQLRRTYEELLRAAAAAPDARTRDSILGTAVSLNAGLVPTGRTLADSMTSIQLGLAAETDTITSLARAHILAHQQRSRQLAGWGQRNIVTVLLLVLVALAWLVIRLPNQAVLPIKRIINGLRRTEEGDLDVNIKIRSRDELGELARQLNRAFARLRDFDEKKTDHILRLERRFRLLANDISEGVLVIDQEPKVVFANQTLEPLLGMSVHEASGRKVGEITNLDFLSEALGWVLAGAAGSQSCEIPPELPGSVVCIEALRDRTGRITGAMLVITNPAQPQPLTEEPADSPPAVEPPAAG